MRLFGDTTAQRIIPFRFAYLALDGVGNIACRCLGRKEMSAPIGQCVGYSADISREDRRAMHKTFPVRQAKGFRRGKQAREMASAEEIGEAIGILLFVDVAECVQTGMARNIGRRKTRGKNFGFLAAVLQDFCNFKHEQQVFAAPILADKSESQRRKRSGI